MDDLLFEKALLVQRSREEFKKSLDDVIKAKKVVEDAKAAKIKLINSKKTQEEVNLADDAIKKAEDELVIINRLYDNKVTFMQTEIVNVELEGSEAYIEASNELADTYDKLQTAKLKVTEAKKYKDSIDGPSAKELSDADTVITAAENLLKAAESARDIAVSELNNGSDGNQSIMDEFIQEMNESRQDIRDIPNLTALQSIDGTTLDPSNVTLLGLETYNSLQTELAVNQIPFNYPDIKDGVPITHEINLPSPDAITQLELTNTINLSKSISELIEQETIRINNLTTYYESKNELVELLTPSHGTSSDNIDKAIKFYERSSHLQAAKSNYEVAQRQRMLQSLTCDVVLAKKVSDYKVGDYNTCRDHPNEMPGAMKY